MILRQEVILITWCNKENKRDVKVLVVKTITLISDHMCPFNHVIQDGSFYGISWHVQAVCMINCHPQEHKSGNLYIKMNTRL
jgi:hypothetical protein